MGKFTEDRVIAHDLPDIGTASNLSRFAGGWNRQKHLSIDSMKLNRQFERRRTGVDKNSFVVYLSICTPARSRARSFAQRQNRRGELACRCRS